MKTEYIYGDGIDDVVAIYKQENNSFTRWEQNEEKPSENIQESLYFIQKDIRGSTVLVTDEGGMIAQSFEYDEFGNILSKVSNTDVNYERLFTGREYEEELGLYYYRARFYDPLKGVFLSRDPLGIVDSVNLYTYVNNDPVNFRDPMGKKAKDLFVNAYDTYLELKNTIYNVNKFNGEILSFDITFLLMDSTLQERLFTQYNDAKNTAKTLHYARNILNTNLPGTIEDAKNQGWIQPSFLGISTYLGSYYHQDEIMQGVELKFVSPDGHKEVIFDQNSNVINNPKYIGTYNFFNPSNTRKHKKYDVNPYYEWGN